MLFIVFLFFGISSSLSAADGLTPEQRAEAKAFVRDCFEWLERDQQEKKAAYQADLEKNDRDADLLLSNAYQIDFRKLREVSERYVQQEAALNETEAYEKSLLRPKEKIGVWTVEQEYKAKLLQVYMSLTDEWKEYKKDPGNKKAYELLHKQMQYMAGILVTGNADRMFVAGTHAFAQDPDEQVNYDADRVFFLALYLLDKDLKQEHGGAAQSSA